MRNHIWHFLYYSDSYFYPHHSLVGQDAGINISPLAVPFFLRGTIIGITYRVVAEKQFNYKEYLRVIL